MTELILKSDLDEVKLEILKKLFASWNIKIEIKRNDKSKSKDNVSFFDGAGIWKDYDIDAAELRKKAWERSK